MSVTIQEGGRQRKMPMQELIVRRLVNDAARGNPRALKLLFALMERYGDAHQEEEQIYTFTLNIGDKFDGSGEPTE